MGDQHESKSKTKCTIGILESIAREAMAEWDKSQADEWLASASVTYVDQVPKYPTPGTPEYYRCINKWYNCMMQARQMDSWLQQIGLLQGQLNSGQPILDALVGAYQDCMEGTPV